MERSHVVVPQIIFTVNGEGVKNPRSTEVIEKMAELNCDPLGGYPLSQRYETFASPMLAKEFFVTSGIPPAAAVVLSDTEGFLKKQFQALVNETFNTVSESDWTCGAQWKII